LEVILRELKLKDLEALLHWTHPDREFHKFNGPYFPKETHEELKKYIETLRERLIAGDSNPYGNKKIIANRGTDEIIGSVNWYWKSIETLWMEVGIVIFNENYWGRGIGKIALEMWIDELFNSYPDIVRLGLSTWSGNTRMMRLAESLGLKREAVYRKARIVEGRYYDSLSYGILREEWESRKNKKMN
jgi:putative hydrolase of HD superfamily